MNGVQRIAVVTYVVLILAGVIPLLIFPAASAGRLFGNYVLLYLIVTGVSWWAFGDRHPMAKAKTRALYMPIHPPRIDAVASLAALGQRPRSPAQYAAMPGPQSDRACPLESITGLVLAGGLGRRMGGEDKGLSLLAGRPMVAHVLERLRPQVGTLLVSANRNVGSYAAFGYPVLADTIGGNLGPLAGVLTAMQRCQTEFLVTAPCDAPLVAPDLVTRLYAACVTAGTDIAVASDGEMRQPVFLLARASLAPSLQAYLEGGDRKADRWVCQLHAALADFSDQPDTFLNVNDPDERQRVEARLVSSGALR